ncbi:MAG TPA: hypothetical protein DCP31_16765 [Cyanobacteria bacterium UBA8543]|nr:hypothetical protein [Cyanobacteria bacterium UBA8543]
MVLRISSRQRRDVSSQTRRSRVRLFVWLMPMLAASLLFGYKQIESYFVQPEAIFVLGGAEKREVFAAKFAHKHPNLPIWVSSGSPKGYAKGLFAKAGVEASRVHLDYQAVDTVTNFTSLVDQLKAQGIDSVYLITSDDHMRRARVIGEIVFGSRGIALKPVSVSSGRQPEPIEKALRDGARAMLWVTTGHTGATFGQVSDKIKK